MRMTHAVKTKHALVRKWRSIKPPKERMRTEVHRALPPNQRQTVIEARDPEESWRPNPKDDPPLRLTIKRKEKKVVGANTIKEKAGRAFTALPLNVTFKG